VDATGRDWRRRVIFYVELVNRTDSRDNEAVKVDAPDIEKARTAAQCVADARGGVSVGRAVSARVKKIGNKVLLTHLRSIAGRTIKWAKWMQYL